MCFPPAISLRPRPLDKALLQRSPPQMSLPVGAANPPSHTLVGSEKPLPVICSTGRAGGLATVDDGIVRMLLEYRFRSDRPVGFGRYHSCRQCSRYQELESSRTVRSFDGFF